jgi:hypothetical protein
MTISSQPRPRANGDRDQLAGRWRSGELCRKPAIELQSGSLDGIWHDVGVARESDLRSSWLALGRGVSHEH